MNVYNFGAALLWRVVRLDDCVSHLYTTTIADGSGVLMMRVAGRGWSRCLVTVWICYLKMIQCAYHQIKINLHTDSDTVTMTWMSRIILWHYHHSSNAIESISLRLYSDAYPNINVKTHIPLELDTITVVVLECSTYWMPPPPPPTLRFPDKIAQAKDRIALT